MKWSNWNDTTGKSKKYSVNFVQTGAEQGWQCPVCQRVLAPFMRECPCKGHGMQTYTTASMEVKDE